MTAALRALWLSRAPRERLALAVALGLFAAIACVMLFAAALEARGPLQRDVAALRADALRMDQQSAELTQLRAATPAPAAPVELRALVQSSLEAASLASVVARLDAADPERVVVEFAAVDFDGWLLWLQALAARQVRVESCRVEALPAPGRVSATVTLVRSAPP